MTGRLPMTTTTIDKLVKAGYRNYRENGYQSNQ